MAFGKKKVPKDKKTKMSPWTIRGAKNVINNAGNAIDGKPPIPNPKKR